MIAVIQKAFPEIQERGCITEINEKHLYVIEDQTTKKAKFVSKTAENHLHVENSCSFPYYFIQNDACVMQFEDAKQCDYVIFNKLDFYFYEIKVTENNKTKNNHKLNAYKQLESTYKFYNDKLSFSNIISHAIIVFPSKRRIIQTSKSTKRKEFKVKYKIDLREGNYIIFE